MLWVSQRWRGYAFRLNCGIPNHALPLSVLSKAFTTGCTSRKAMDFAVVCGCTFTARSEDASRNPCSEALAGLRIED